MDVGIRRATVADIETVASILAEAANWLVDREMSMWRADELNPDRIAGAVSDGLFFLGERDGQAVGTFKFQISDEEFWPDLPHGDSAFLHRLAVRRRVAGTGVSAAMILWAIERAARLGRRYLRLDCDASRQKLRTFYERLGFQYHSDRHVGPYLVARYQFVIPQDPNVPGRVVDDHRNQR